MPTAVSTLNARIAGRGVAMAPVLDAEAAQQVGEVHVLGGMAQSRGEARRV